MWAASSQARRAGHLPHFSSPAQHRLFVGLAFVSVMSQIQCLSKSLTGWDALYKSMEAFLTRGAVKGHLAACITVAIDKPAVAFC